MSAIEGKRNGTFVRITNREVWDMLGKIDNKVDGLIVEFTNHLSHHKKFERNMKWMIPTTIAIVTVILEVILRLK